VTAAGTVLAVLVLASALLSDLFVAPVLADRTRRAIAAGEPDPRVDLHRLIVVFGWAFAAASVGVLLLGGLSLHEIGFAGADLDDPAVQPLLLGMVGGVLAPLVLPRRTQPQRLIGDVGLLLPVTRRERRSYAAAALTAGITEEITYRALPILLLLHLLPGHNRLLAVGVSAVLFGLAHRYQGWAGMVLTGVIGLVLGGLYVLTGSLWPSMLIHVLLDLRPLFVRTSAAVGRDTGGDPGRLR
jgi:membrane protease YdiL (CAAX protease family)